ncbi:response regulator transcription factor [Paenibacillus sp. LS1]|uniref:response regulator transcription factor n=1 Tax=Paenibacillus sp. LS1 TaxID=2992120 RepID=UPI00222F2D76|nr:response regulator transcription factor [Paenibacillus sp. LS1]MCW3792665.1 response regulator transcription factor [Paenibacillus sp. LS1]
MRKRTLLIVEDEARLRMVITDYFSQANWYVVEAENGRDAIERLAENEIDLVITDILMPVMDGWDLCRTIRRESNIPIIVLTSKAEDEDKLRGYEMGSDDYIGKPFSPKVLVAKANSLLDRIDGVFSASKTAITGTRLAINSLAHEVEVNGKIVSLGPKEFDILLYFIKNRGIVLSRESILNQIWGYNFDGDIRVVDTQIKRLRAKIGDEADLIQTVPRYGYKFAVKL